MHKTLFERQKVYDNAKYLLQKNRVISRISVYKIFTLSYLFVSLVLLLILRNYGLFNNKVISPAYFLNFSEAIYEEFNWVLIFRISILGFLYFYPLIKAYLNIEINKPHLKTYNIWFSLYLGISFSAFTLFFTFTSREIKQVINLIYGLIGLLVIDISFTLFNFVTKRKINPLIYSNKLPLYVDIISRTLLCISTLVIFLLWANNNETGSMIVNNSFYQNILLTFTVKTFTNFLIIFTGSIALGLLFIGLKIYWIWTLIYKQFSIDLIKNRMSFYVVMLFSVFVWLISLFWLKITPNHKLFNNVWNIEYLFVLFGVLNFIIFILFTYFVYVKNKIKSPLIRYSALIVYQWVLWTIFMISTFLYDKSEVSFINLLLTVICSLIALYWHFKRHPYIAYQAYVLIITNLVLVFIVMLLFGLNYFLLSINNKSFNFLISGLTLTQTVSMLVVIIKTISLVYILINMSIVLNKISKTN
ncbi:MSC_0624 family F1-like ATPase-associated membrane protein [Mycoplasma capricolum]|uniref:MSC_0624 family F1-like ATPase-associated membrane protein n=1 Tax=Mycoplasma capricolum TaxID=2095 RepID=UPI003DA59843